MHLLEQLVLSLHSDLRRDIWLQVAEYSEVAAREQGYVERCRVLEQWGAVGR